MACKQSDRTRRELSFQKKKEKIFIFALTYLAKKILLSNYFNTDFSFFSRNENRAKLSVILNRLAEIWPSVLTVRL